MDLRTTIRDALPPEARRRVRRVVGFRRSAVLPDLVDYVNQVGRRSGCDRVLLVTGTGAPLPEAKWFSLTATAERLKDVAGSRLSSSIASTALMVLGVGDQRDVDPAVALIGRSGQRLPAVVLCGPGDLVDVVLDRTATVMRFRPPAATGSDGVVVALSDPWQRPAELGEPPPVSVHAVMTVFNEADVIAQTLDALIDDGIGVHVLDNWSTDATPDIVRERLGSGVLSIERYPDTDTFDRPVILRRLEQIAAASGADWVAFIDADEVRDSPWPQLSYHQAISRADRLGYTVLDHTVLNFLPLDVPPAGPLELSAFARAYWGINSGNLRQMRAWRNPHRLVDLVSEAGHEVVMSGRRTLPWNALQRHYPYRTVEHATRKVEQERRPRLVQAALDRGWHRHYFRDPLELPDVEVFDYEPATVQSRDQLTLLARAGLRPRLD